MRKLIRRHGLAVSFLILAAAALLLVAADHVGASTQLVLRLVGAPAMLIAGYALLKLASARIRDGLVAHTSVSRPRDWSKPGGSDDDVESDPAILAYPGTAA